MTRQSWRCVIVIAAMLSLSTSLFGQDLFQKNKPIQHSRHQRVEIGQTIGGYPILHFESDLRLINLDVQYAGGGDAPIPLAVATMGSVIGGVFVGAMAVEANLESLTMADDWTDEPCKGEDYLWKKSIGGAFSNVNCATISYITGISETVPTVIQLQFTRYSSGARRLSYLVRVNPEAFCVRKDSGTTRESSDWHKTRLDGDANRTRLLKYFEKWAGDVLDRMDDAFDKKQDAFLTVPFLRSCLSPNGSVGIG